MNNELSFSPVKLGNGEDEEITPGEPTPKEQRPSWVSLVKNPFKSQKSQGYTELASLPTSHGSNPSFALLNDPQKDPATRLKSKRVTNADRVSMFRTVMEELEEMWEFEIKSGTKQSSNSVRTSKYTLWSFLPLNLFH